MWKERFLTSLQTNRFALILALSGLLLIAIGITTSVLSDNKSKGIILEEAASTSATQSPSLAIMVDVSGAVEKPGVYKLVENARVQEALIAAGGLSKNADRPFLAKSLNLAAKLSDGIKIYIPSIGENAVKTEVSAVNVQTVQTGLVAGTTTGLISINNAASLELESLPGIGPVTAGKIIDNRPYGSIDDLLSKKVVSKSVFEKIKAKITLN